MQYFDLIRLGIPQSALAFIFIGRGSHTPLQVGLYKNFQNKTKPTRITTGQTGRPDRSNRSASELPELAVNICPLLFGEFHKPKSKNYPDVHVLHRTYKSKNKTKGDIQYQPSSSSRTLPYARIKFLQVSPIDSSR